MYNLFINNPNNSIIYLLVLAKGLLMNISSSYTAKCNNSHLSNYMCFDKNCKHPSLICKESGCEYSKS